jgi:hypothetical protein
MEALRFARSSEPPPSFTWAIVYFRAFSWFAPHGILATCAVGFRFRYRKVWGFKSLLLHYSETIREVGESKTILE